MKTRLLESLGSMLLALLVTIACTVYWKLPWYMSAVVYCTFHLLVCISVDLDALRRTQEDL